LQINTGEPVSTAQEKQLSAAGFTVENAGKPTQSTPPKTGDTVFSLSGRLDWNRIEKLIALPLVHQVLLPPA